VKKTKVFGEPPRTAGQRPVLHFSSASLQLRAGSVLGAFAALVGFWQEQPAALRG